MGATQGVRGLRCCVGSPSYRFRPSSELDQVRTSGRSRHPPRAAHAAPSVVIEAPTVCGLAGKRSARLLHPARTRTPPTACILHNHSAHHSARHAWRRVSGSPGCCSAPSACRADRATSPGHAPSAPCVPAEPLWSWCILHTALLPLPVPHAGTSPPLAAPAATHTPPGACSMRSPSRPHPLHSQQAARQPWSRVATSAAQCGVRRCQRLVAARAQKG